MPVPRFDAVAAKRLTQLATQLRDAPPDRAWVAAVASLGVVGILVAAVIGGYLGGGLLQPTVPVTIASNMAPSATPSTAIAAQVSPVPGPSQPTQSVPSQTESLPVAIEYRKLASPWHDSSLLLLAIPLLLASIALGIYT
jgi:hypothetical protein